MTIQLSSQARDFASVAADMASTDTEVRVRGAIDFVRHEVRCDTFLLAYKTPGSKGFSLVSSVGYSEAVAGYLTSDIESKPEFFRQFGDCTRVWDWEDVPEFPDSYSGAKVLRPEGFANGFIMVLHDGAGEVVGLCQGNMESPEFSSRSPVPGGDGAAVAHKVCRPHASTSPGPAHRSGTGDPRVAAGRSVQHRDQ